LRNQGRLAAKSAMSSRSPCVVAIIARSTAVAMKRHGGKRWALIRLFPLVPCGWKAIHYPQRAVTNKAGENLINESDGLRTTKRSQFLTWAPNDLHQTVRGQRRNSLKSTGPKTEAGKQASRCNAVRHGLTAETVIGALEDAEDYKVFEAAITADYDAQSAVEREKAGACEWERAAVDAVSSAPRSANWLLRRLYVWPSLMSFFGCCRGSTSGHV
jgi:hypothetical protein